MISESPSTDAPVDTAANQPATVLTLSCTVDSDADTDATSSVFSSIRETAGALVAVASEQAVQRAKSPALRPGGLRESVGNVREQAIQRANADQARRVAECTRAAFDSLVRHTTQPCFALDEANQIVRWNAAMADWTGIPEGDALNSLLSTVFSDGSASEIEAAGTALREAEALPGGLDADPVFVVERVFSLRCGAVAERVSLLPLCRVPRVVEAIVVLITPLPQTPD